jgi:hypothetical protein
MVALPAVCFSLKKEFGTACHAAGPFFIGFACGSGAL